jgi:hypothetical protein
MDDTALHMKITEENLEGALDELKSKRLTNVGLLSLRALEQMIEACASKEGLHFHELPRTAHKSRRNWLKSHHPDLLEAWEQLWGIHGALGYGGLDGKRAERAVAILKECLAELSRRENIAIAGV